MHNICAIYIIVQAYYYKESRNSIRDYTIKIIFMGQTKFWYKWDKT